MQRSTRLAVITGLAMLLSVLIASPAAAQQYPGQVTWRQAASQTRAGGAPLELLLIPGVGGAATALVGFGWRRLRQRG